MHERFNSVSVPRCNERPVIRRRWRGRPPPARPPVDGAVWSPWNEAWIESDESLAARIKAIQNGEPEPEPEPRESDLYWLSFADANLPEGKQFLGVAIIQADTLEEAIVKSWKMQVNPGGEVVGHRIYYRPEAREIPFAYQRRLLSKRDIDQLMREVEGE